MRSSSTALVAFLGIGFVGPVMAQEGATGTNSVEVTPGPQYEASGWWRFWWGDHYRDAWTTPLRSEVLDCSAFTGGVVPDRATSGRQTRTLRLQGLDGRHYYYRSLDKDPTEVLPPVLRNSVAADVLRDQTSSQHPLAALVVSPLAEAAGVFHADPKLVTFADDAGLGEHREEFAGLPGLIEEAADERLGDLAQFGQPLEVVGSRTLLERVRGSTADRVDSRALLTARLLDFYVGDWDRHAGQWRWAAFDREGVRAWYPIPLDRDQAFSRLDGVFPSMAQSLLPLFTGFGADYDVMSLHWNARFVDRQFLTGIDRFAFDSVATSLARAFTDEVIENALRRLPPALYDLDAERLGRHLRARRPTLPGAADRFYLLMAREVDIHATNEAERVDVVALPPEAIEIRIATPQAGAPPHYRRTFRRDETKEVRIYLNGGDDTAVIRGAERLPIQVRIVGGGGDDVVEFETDTRGVSVYDVTGDTRVIGSRSQKVDDRPFQDPPEIPDPMRHPHRDWGRATMPGVALGLSSDYGLKAGGGMSWFDFGFRKSPYASKVGLSGALSTRLQYELAIDGDFRFENSSTYVMGRLGASRFDVLNFYGFGNDTPELDPSAARVHLTTSGLELAVGSFLSSTTSFAVGPLVTFSRTEDDPARFINQLPELYGREDFWQAGAFARFDWDSRRNIRIGWKGEMPALTGASLTARGQVFPAWLDVADTYGWLEGELRGFLHVPVLKEATHLAARVGGRRVWSEFPWFEAAFVGGRPSLRGWRANRFAGDASAYGSVEARLHLFDGQFLFPSMWGVLGFADVGRVWLDGESPGGAHWGYGGGLWWGLLGTRYVISLEIAAGDEDTTAYLEWAFTY